jgi:hypothetical protein
MAAQGLRGAMSNPMDIMEVARDLVRKDEAQHLFEVLSDGAPGESLPVRTDYRDGYRDGLAFALDRLDERIGFLRDKWTDSGVL